MQKYRLVGRLIGRYYDKDGDPTAALILAETQASLYKEREESKKYQKSRLCDVSWNQKDGGWVECPLGLVPRRVPWALSNGTVKEKCVCLRQDKTSEAQKEYDGCDSQSNRCRTAPGEGVKSSGGGEL